MNKTITFKYEGKEYTLEYDRKTIKILEAHGLSLDKVEGQPLTTMELLWQGAFLKNHKNEKEDKILDMYRNIKDKSALNEGLITMYRETYLALLGDDEDIDDSKKIEWKMS
jgi:hypothetical protein